jgi:carbonic anhydrase
LKKLFSDSLRIFVDGAEMRANGQFFLALLTAMMASSSCMKWGYENGNGPDKWPDMCASGQRQSPIDVKHSMVDIIETEELHFINYDPHGPVEFYNSGHSAGAMGFDKWPKRPALAGGGLNGVYELHGFHFHWSEDDSKGSDHKLGSLHYPLEAHFVHAKHGMELPEAHKLPDGLAIVTVFFALHEKGSALKHIEKALNMTKKYDAKAQMEWFRPGELIPTHRSTFYRYNGSLTLYPCTESVVWTLLSEPLYVSAEQLELLRAHENAHGERMLGNNRPVQPMNGRRVLQRFASSHHIHSNRYEASGATQLYGYHRISITIFAVFVCMFYFTLSKM